MTNRILVVGAGICGLAVAAELSRKIPTVLIDRLPVIGGITSSYENSVAVKLADAMPRQRRRIPFRYSRPALDGQ